MGLATSIVIFAVGAVLAFAVNVTSSAVDIQTVGVILMIVGGVGFVASLLFWASWGGWGIPRGGPVYRDRDAVYEDRARRY